MHCLSFRLLCTPQSLPLWGVRHKAHSLIHGSCSLSEFPFPRAPVSNLLFSYSLTLQSKPQEKQILIHTLTLSIRPSSLFTLEMFATTTNNNNHHHDHHENASNTLESPVWTFIDLGHRAEAQAPHFRPTNLDLEAPSPSSNNNNNNNKKRHWLRRSGGGRNKSRKTVVVVCIVAVVSMMLVGVVGTAVVVGR